jgi:hypothetical protein
MANALLSWINHVDREGTLFQTDSQVTGAPAKQLAEPIVAYPWRTNATTQSYVEIDWQADQPVRLLILAGASLAGTDTVRHRLTADGGLPTDGDQLDTGAIACGVAEGYGLHAYVLPATVQARYWRLDIDAPSRVDAGYFDVGRAWAGDAFQPERNYSLGWQEQWQDASKIHTAPRSGAEFVEPRYQRRILTLALEALSRGEALDDLKEMGRIAGSRAQVAFVPDPDSTRLQREALIGRLAESTPIARPDAAFFTKDLEIRQSL